MASASSRSSFICSSAALALASSLACIVRFTLSAFSALSSAFFAASASAARSLADLGGGGGGGLGGAASASSSSSSSLSLSLWLWSSPLSSPSRAKAVPAAFVLA